MTQIIFSLRIVQRNLKEYTPLMVLFVDYPDWISPYVIEGLPVRWYAVMYIFAFGTAYYLYLRSIRNDRNLPRSKKETYDDFFLVAVISLLVGARLGSCFFYDDAVYYLTHPYMIFWPFRNGKFVGLPGMSYHGGVIGAFIGGVIFAKVKKLDFLKLADHVALSIPFGYTWGRLGNFFNGELYGRVTTSKIGMVFPDAQRFSTSIDWVRDTADKLGIEYVLGDYVNLPRWPSQLFEAFFEGIVLGLFLWLVVRKIKEKKKQADGTILSFYLIGYGCIRFVIEYFRQPDADIGYVLSFGQKSDNIYLFDGVGNISKGQVFCFLMVCCGILLLVISNVIRKRNNDKRKS